MAKKEVSQAAEKVAAAEKKKEKKPANPNGNIFVRAGKAIKKFCKDLKGEIKKITWPDRKTVLKSTFVVLVVVIVCAIVIGGIDWLLSQGMSLLERGAQSLAGSNETTTAVAQTTTAATTQIAGIINLIG